MRRAGRSGRGGRGRAKSKSNNKDSARSATPPPRSPTPPPPSNVNMSTAKKSDRRSAKLTDAQQDIMFGEQAVRMGSVDGTTLQLWFKSCRTVISKCKTRKSGTNWSPDTHGTPNEKRLWTKMSWLVPFIRPPRRHNLKSVSMKSNCRQCSI